MYSWVDLAVIGGLVVGLWLLLRHDERDERNEGCRDDDEERVDIHNIYDRRETNEAILRLGDRLERTLVGRQGGHVTATLHCSPSDCKRLDYVTSANLAWLMRDGRDKVRVRFTEPEREGEPFDYQTMPARARRAPTHH